MALTYMILMIYIGRFIKAYKVDLYHYFSLLRAISVVFHMLGVIMLMLFIPLSDMYLKHMNPTYIGIGELLRLSRDLTFIARILLPLSLPYS